MPIPPHKYQKLFHGEDRGFCGFCGRKPDKCPGYAPTPQPAEGELEAVLDQIIDEYERLGYSTAKQNGMPQLLGLITAREATQAKLVDERFEEALGERPTREPISDSDADYLHGLTEAIDTARQRWYKGKK